MATRREQNIDASAGIFFKVREFGLRILAQNSF
jgi:hypothetical protein